MTKAVLIIWIGLGTSQTMSMTTFDSVEECRSAKAALVEVYSSLGRGKCVPYEVPE